MGRSVTLGQDLPIIGGQGAFFVLKRLPRIPWCETSFETPAAAESRGRPISTHETRCL